ncbi:MAG TPA: hypothetical protein P5277_02535 [Candidatus Paceibacterota bacterium]|nr:hypothetical protein [Candidatus Paceibacterota bacterium]
MPSREHQQKIEEIDREIKSRGMNWKTKKNYPVWLHKENNWGQIDLVGFKKEDSFSPAVIDAYEIEERNSSGQISRNLEKLAQLRKITPLNIKVFTCQLKANQDHKTVCSRK